MDFSASGESGVVSFGVVKDVPVEAVLHDLAVVLRRSGECLHWFLNVPVVFQFTMPGRVDTCCVIVLILLAEFLFWAGEEVLSKQTRKLSLAVPIVRYLNVRFRKLSPAGKKELVLVAYLSASAFWSSSFQALLCNVK